MNLFAFRECVKGLPQYEATKAYMPKEPDELGLQQAELVIVLQTEDGESTAEAQHQIQILVFGATLTFFSS